MPRGEQSNEFSVPTAPPAYVFSSVLTATDLWQCRLAEDQTEINSLPHSESLAVQQDLITGSPRLK